MLFEWPGKDQPLLESRSFKETPLTTVPQTQRWTRFVSALSNDENGSKLLTMSRLYRSVPCLLNALTTVKRLPEVSCPIDRAETGFTPSGAVLGSLNRGQGKAGQSSPPKLVKHLSTNVMLQNDVLLPLFTSQPFIAIPGVCLAS